MGCRRRSIVIGRWMIFVSRLVSCDIIDSSFGRLMMDRQKRGKKGLLRAGHEECILGGGGH